MSRNRNAKRLADGSRFVGSAEVRANIKQHCPLAFVWLTWLGVPALALYLALSESWIAAIVVVAAAILAQLAYLRLFPRVSRLLGYGSVADLRAHSTVSAPPRVVLYTANVCPFCPIVRRRLEKLREELDFALEEVDVTFRPRIVKDKGLRSVPVIEAGGRLLVGNATSAELSAFLAEAAGGYETTA